MADFLKALCVANNLLLQGKKIYIWGNDDVAARMFTKLCALSVKIAGFISDEWSGTTLWHRPVVSLHDIDAADSIICIYDTRKIPGGGYNELCLCRHPVILNPEFDKKRAVIYGAGRTGIQILHFLQDAGIEVSCFIDSKKKGNRIEGILVEDDTYLENLSESIYVVEAGYFYKEIDETVSKYIGSNKRFFRKKPLEAKYCGIDLTWANVLGIETILEIEQFSNINSYYLYGACPELAEMYQHIFALMDMNLTVIEDSLNDAGKGIVDILY